MALVNGNASGNVLQGTVGNDYINGFDGDDTLYSNGGADHMSGGNGNDIFHFGNGKSFGFGGSGDDIFNSKATGNTIVGGDGFDTLSYLFAPVGMQIDMAAGTAQRIGWGNTKETFSSIEKVLGTDFADTINGSAKADVVNGWYGDDKILGLDGFDTLYGHSGNDWVDGGNGSDTVTGDAGNDILIGGRGADNVSGGAGNDTIIGGELFGVDDLAQNTLSGGLGNDNIEGGAGSDIIYGGDGLDWIDGGDGLNYIWFGKDGPSGSSGPFPGFMDYDRDTLMHDCNGVNKLDKVRDFGFAEGDRIILDNTGFKSFAEVQNAMKSYEGGVYIKTGADSALWIMDCTKASFTADDFILS